MSDVYITKTGFRATEWSPEERAYVDKPINHIYHELRSVCHIEDGVTLGDIIRNVADNEGLAFLVEQYAWCNVKAFREELDKPFLKPSTLTAIQLTRHIKLNKDDMDISIHVNGVGPDEGGQVTDNWAIEFTPVNEMKDVPIRIDPKTKVIDWRTWDGNEVKEIAELDTYFSLLDVVGEIFYEISFCGSPCDRNEMFGELMNSVEHVKNGTAKTVPLDSLLDDKIQ